MRIIDRIQEHISIPEASLFGKLKNILFGAALYVAWIEFMYWVYVTFIPEFKGIGGGEDPYHSFIYTFLGGSILAPFIEEFLYRTPLSIARNINIKNAILYTALYSSILFGLEHWGGNWTVPWQGAAGLIFCYVYIKNGYSYISSVAMHVLINYYYSFISN